jgi:hypothetical protein
LNPLHDAGSAAGIDLLAEEDSIEGVNVPDTANDKHALVADSLA